MREPYLPKVTHDPTRLKDKEKSASKMFIRRIRGAYEKVIEDVIKTIDVRVIELNESARYISNREKVWKWEIDQSGMNRAFNTIKQIIDSFILSDVDGMPVNEYDPSRLWFFDTYVKHAYIKGTSEAYRDLSIQSETYQAVFADIQSVLMSEPYQRRAGLIASREYSLLKGLSDEMQKATGEILTTAIIKGENPREVAKKLLARAPSYAGETGNKLDSARAVRIAQSELTGALRQAKSDEAANADEKFKIKSMLMPLSAFMTTSRYNHMARHGTLVTYKQQADFYSEPKQFINCHCSVIVVVLGSDGKPLSQGLVDKAVAQRMSRIGR